MAPKKSQGPLDDHSDHKHFLCTGCATGFCSSHENYTDLKDGDPCPECHIATVREVAVMQLPQMPSLGAEMAEGMQGMLDKLDEQMTAAREVRLLSAAVLLYPYITHVFPSPEEVGAVAAGSEIADPAVSRALRCVDVAFGMEAAIRARLDKEAGL